MKVLVADASQEDRGRVADALSGLTQFELHGAANLYGALRALACGAPDVVVTDVRFPDGEGVCLIEAARRHEEAPAIVVLSSIDSPEQRQRCLDAGADLYLVKNDALDDLQRGVSDLARDRRAARWRGAPSHDDHLAVLGRIAGGVAHDLNNYFTVMEMALCQVHGQLAGGAGLKDLAQARAALDGATRLTRALVQYARGGAPARGPIKLAALVRRVVELIGRVLPTDVRLNLDLDDELPVVEGVAVELEQLMINLLVNAGEAMPNGGELSVSLRAAGAAAVALEVSDSGRGIPDELSQVAGATSPSSKRDRQGEGLGLGIVRSVVAHHGAALRIGARAGGGTRVVVVFFTK
jgi:signal transduction histidine kinase